MELSLVERGERVATVPIGTVYGALLNDRGALAALGDAVHAPPYHKPPRASVLYVKPANTHAGDGAAVVVPAGVDALEIGATLGVVFARRTTRVPAEQAFVLLKVLRLPATCRFPILIITGRRCASSAAMASARSGRRSLRAQASATRTRSP